MSAEADVPQQGEGQQAGSEEQKSKKQKNRKDKRTFLALALELLLRTLFLAQSII